MLVDPKVEKVYKEIQKQLFYMIPEKWSKIYLYSSIVERQKKLEIGELYFYYIPKGVLKKNPINVYEIPNKFSIDENQYMKLVDKLYTEIKKLQKVMFDIEGEKWDSLVISIANFKLAVEYNYENFSNYKFSSYEKHVIFRYKYLEYTYSSFNKDEKKIISKYFDEKKNQNIKTKKYSEAMYQIPADIIEANSKKAGIQYVKENDIRLIEEKKEIKSQILKSNF